MENNKNKKSVKFQGDVLNFCDFIQVFVFTRNHHLNVKLFANADAAADANADAGGSTIALPGLRQGELKMIIGHFMYRNKLCD